jgi:hypothetical protein
MRANVFRSTPKADIGGTHGGDGLHSKSNIMRTAALRHKPPVGSFLTEREDYPQARPADYPASGTKARGGDWTSRIGERTYRNEKLVAGLVAKRLVSNGLQRHIIESAVTEAWMAPKK